VVGERFVGLVAEHIANVTNRGAELCHEGECSERVDEKDPLFMPVSRPTHGNFGVAASGSRRGRLGRPPGSGETAEQRR
jgi:hypothetical protein